MKCEDCNAKYRMKFIQNNMHIDGRDIRFDNIPAWVCPVCGASHMDEDILANAKAFARATANLRLDYEQCEELFGGIHLLHNAE